MRARLIKKVASERMTLILAAFAGRTLKPEERSRLRRLDRIAARYLAALSATTQPPAIIIAPPKSQSSANCER